MCAFEVGNFVHVFWTSRKDQLQNQWQGPIPITRLITTVTYQIDLGAKVKKDHTFHVNVIRKWNAMSTEVFLA